jgi:hypothetical protein
VISGTVVIETMLCGVVWCGVVWCGVVWCGVVWCGVVPYLYAVEDVDRRQDLFLNRRHETTQCLHIVSTNVSAVHPPPVSVAYLVDGHDRLLAVDPSTLERGRVAIFVLLGCLRAGRLADLPGAQAKVLRLEQRRDFLRLKERLTKSRGRDDEPVRGLMAHWEQIREDPKWDCVRGGAIVRESSQAWSA